MGTTLLLGATIAVAAETFSLWAASGERLFLVGRNGDKLEALEQRLGEAVLGRLASDFDDDARNTQLVEQVIDRLGAVDTVLVAHGDLGDQLRSEENAAEAARLIHTNFTSVVSLLLPVANHMERERTGRIVVISSVAGERGRPRNFTYGASKRAVRTYLQGLRSRLYPAGVSVTTILLGPVDTPMTVGHDKNALFTTAPKAAAAIIRASERRVPEAYVPSYWRPIMWAVRNTPEFIFQRVSALSGR